MSVREYEFECMRVRTNVGMSEWKYETVCMSVQEY